MTDTQPRYCLKCRRVRMCQRPGGMWIFALGLILFGFTTFTYFSSRHGLQVGAICFLVVILGTAIYLKLASDRPWKCQSCAGTKTEANAPDDDDDDRPRGRKRPGPPPIPGSAKTRADD